MSALNAHRLYSGRNRVDPVAEFFRSSPPVSATSEAVRLDPSPDGTELDFGWPGLDSPPSFALLEWP